MADAFDAAASELTLRLMLQYGTDCSDSAHAVIVDNIAATLRATAAAESARGAAEERGRWVAACRSFYAVFAAGRSAAKRQAAIAMCLLAHDAAGVTLDAEPGSGGENG